MALDLKGSGYGCKGHMRDLCCDKKVLCFDCVSVSILVVTMYYRFAKCYLYFFIFFYFYFLQSVIFRGNWVKGTWHIFIILFLYYFLQLNVNLQL